VPFTAEVKEPRYRMKAMEAEERNSNYVEYEIPYSREEIVAESTRCSSARARRSGYCDLRRLGIEYGTTLTTLEPQTPRGRGLRSVNENRFTGVNHDYVRDDSHAFILREPSRCIDCGRCAQGLLRGRRRRVLRLHADRLRHARDDPLDMSLNDTPVRVVRSLRRDLPDGAPDAEAARASRSTRSTRAAASCAGICVDACPTTRSATAASSSSHTRAAPSR
jgi:formate dehydrogenase major subunit